MQAAAQWKIYEDLRMANMEYQWERPLRAYEAVDDGLKQFNKYLGADQLK